MSINDIPGLAALRTRMQWHQERQRVLAENVANSDTPGFKPKDLVEPNFDAKGANLSGSMGSLAMMRTSNWLRTTSASIEEVTRRTFASRQARKAARSSAIW